MKANQIVKGGRYAAKVSGQLTTVRVLDIFERTSWKGRVVTRYRCRNERTGREIEVKSPSRFRYAVRSGFGPNHVRVD